MREEGIHASYPQPFVRLHGVAVLGLVTALAGCTAADLPAPPDLSDESTEGVDAGDEGGDGEG